MAIPCFDGPGRLSHTRFRMAISRAGGGTDRRERPGDIRTCTRNRATFQSANFFPFLTVEVINVAQLTVGYWIVAAGLALAGLLFWLMLTEWRFLGSGFVRRSYDWLAPWYEGKWKAPEYQSAETNERLFIDPVLEATGDNPRARVVDLACGTGRVSLLLLARREFRGRIEAVDFSQGMLARFREHLAARGADQRARVKLIPLDLRDWRCDEPGSIDAVWFLEAAELVPRLPQLVREIAAALRPGGVLVTTRVGRRFVWLFRGRHQKGNAMKELLVANGLEVVHTDKWRTRYDVLTARRLSDSLQSAP